MFPNPFPVALAQIFLCLPCWDTLVFQSVLENHIFLFGIGLKVAVIAFELGRLGRLTISYKEGPDYKFLYITATY